MNDLQDLLDFKKRERITDNNIHEGWKSAILGNLDIVGIFNKVIEITSVKDSDNREFILYSIVSECLFYLMLLNIQFSLYTFRFRAQIITVEYCSREQRSDVRSEHPLLTHSLPPRPKRVD